MSSQEKKESDRLRARAYRLLNPERVKEDHRRWRSRDVNKAKLRAWDREYSKSDYSKAYRRNKHLRKCYGLSTLEVEAMRVDQDGRCKICKVELVEGSRHKDALSVDHDHTTKRVRGLLCRQCNHGLGNFKDRPDLLATAAEYLA